MILIKIHSMCLIIEMCVCSSTINGISIGTNITVIDMSNTQALVTFKRKECGIADIHY